MDTIALLDDAGFMAYEPPEVVLADGVVAEEGQFERSAHA